MLRRPLRWLPIALVAVTATASAADIAPADPLRLQLFSGIDRQAVALGETLELTLEALAVPASDRDRDALVAAFAQMDVGAQVGADFEVVRDEPVALKVTGGVVEVTRVVELRVASIAARVVPGLHLQVEADGRRWTYRTRSLSIQPYLPDTRVGRSRQSVVAVVASGEIEGAGFERTGSAFLVGGDALVTAYHVVVGARRVRVRLGDRELDASRAWVLDPVRDVAVLYVDPEEARRAGLAPLVVAPEAAGGVVAFTAGWPNSRQRPTVARRFDDLVLGTRRLRVAANAVSPGDSGGPLLDETGRVLGVVVSGRSTEGLSDLLREDICLASDPGPALAHYRRATAPRPLRHALRAAARVLPSAQVHEAVGAIEVPSARGDRTLHVASLLDALRKSPGDPVLQYLAGTALEEVGETRVAAGALDASRRAGYVPASYSLAHHLMERGRLAEAAVLFSEMAGEGPYAHLGALGEAQSLVALGRYTGAEQALHTVLDHDARFAPALCLLGLVRLSQGREIEAAALLVRLADRPEWSGALRLPVVAPALRMPSLQPLPRVALR